MVQKNTHDRLLDFAERAAMEVLLRYGATRGMTQKNKENCQYEMEVLCRDLYKLGIDKDEFTECCRKAGSSLGKTSAILDFMIGSGTEEA